MILYKEVLGKDDSTFLARRNIYRNWCYLLKNNTYDDLVYSKTDIEELNEDFDDSDQDDRAISEDNDKTDEDEEILEDIYEASEDTDEESEEVSEPSTSEPANEGVGVAAVATAASEEPVIIE